MKLEIYQPEQEKKEEELLRLRLIPCGAHTGGVTLAIVNKEGKRIDKGSILAIKQDGTLRRFSTVHDSIPKDPGGKIRETGA